MNVHLSNVVVNLLAAGYVVPRRWRIKLMRNAGIEIGEGTDVRSRCTFAGPGPVRIGRDGYVNTQCLFDATGPITVADRVYIAQRVSIGTCTHDIGPAEKRAGHRYPAEVRIESGCWIGMNATVLPGVTIGSGCVIAAGAVVASDCAPNGLYGGVPARLIQELEPAPVLA